MYLNQFTNTKKNMYAHCACTMTNVYSGYMLGVREYLQYYFLLQNDMRYIIPYSFSQQNEFYKVLLYKKSQFHKKTVFPP